MKFDRDWTVKNNLLHDDVIKWKHLPRYWSLVRGIHRSLVKVNSPHKGQWRGDLMFYLIWAWINGWANNREAGDLRRHRAHYDVIVMRVRFSRGATYLTCLAWKGVCFKQCKTVFELNLTTFLLCISLLDAGVFSLSHFYFPKWKLPIAYHLYREYTIICVVW